MSTNKSNESLQMVDPQLLKYLENQENHQVLFQKYCNIRYLELIEA